MVSVKDSVTFGLPAHGSMEGMEAGGLDGCLTRPHFKFALSHVAEDVSTDDVEKNGTHAIKNRKRGAVDGPDGDV